MLLYPCHSHICGTLARELRRGRRHCAVEPPVGAARCRPSKRVSGCPGSEDSFLVRFCALRSHWAGPQRAAPSGSQLESCRGGGAGSTGNGRPSNGAVGRNPGRVCRLPGTGRGSCTPGPGTRRAGRALAAWRPSAAAGPEAISVVAQKRGSKDGHCDENGAQGDDRVRAGASRRSARRPLHVCARRTRASSSRQRLIGCPSSCAIPCCWQPPGHWPWRLLRAAASWRARPAALARALRSRPAQALRALHAAHRKRLLPGCLQETTYRDKVVTQRQVVETPLTTTENVVVQVRRGGVRSRQKRAARPLSSAAGSLRVLRLRPDWARTVLRLDCRPHTHRPPTPSAQTPRTIMTQQVMQRPVTTYTQQTYLDTQMVTRPVVTQTVGARRARWAAWGGPGDGGDE